jgi:hypothetical protein
MARTLEQVTELLSKATLAGATGDEVVADVAAIIEAATRAAKLEASKAKGEAQEYRNKLKKDAAIIAKVAAKLDFDPTDDSLDIDEVLESAGKGRQATGELAELAKQLKAVQKSLGDSETRRLAAEKQSADQAVKIQRKTLAEKLSKGLTDEAGKPRVVGADLLVRSLIDDGRVKLSEDGNTVVFVNGDGEVAFDAGIKAVLDERKDLLITTQQPGAASRSAGGVVRTGPATEAERLAALRAADKRF